MNKLKLLAVNAAALGLTGCMSLSGYDANSNFACKAPDGVLCESMTGIYSNAKEQNLPGQRVTHSGQQQTEKQAIAKVSQGVLTQPIYSGTPIRSAPRVLRVWFAPWEDTDGDLHDQNYIYLQVDSGRWLVEHNRRRIQDAYRPVVAPNSGKPLVSQQSNSPAANVQGSIDQGQEVISAVQGRGDNANALSNFVGGIQTLGQLGQQQSPNGQ